MRFRRSLGLLGHQFVWLLAIAFGFTARAAQGAPDPMQGATIETDLFYWPENPPSNLIDASTDTHFALARVLDSEWRVKFAAPVVPEQLELVQGYENWSTATELTLEDARGQVATVKLATGTRELQSFALPFTEPTAFLDVHITEALPSESGEGYGGFAEMRFVGPVEAGDTTPPVISGVSVTQDSPSSATITWKTDEPCTAQLRYSELDAVSRTTTPTAELTTAHEVRLVTDSALGGKVEIRATDAAGNRTELMHDAFTTMSQTFQFGVGGWAFKIDGEWTRAANVFAKDDFRVDTLQAWFGGYDWDETYDEPAEIRKVVDEGYLPEIIHFYFGYPELDEVKERRRDYLDKITRLAEMLRDSQVGDQAIVTLEPEYNQGEVASYDGWNDLMIEAIAILHDVAKAKVGLLPGPWDLGHVVPLSIGRAAAHADFIAFQGMKASTRNTPEEAYALVDDSLRFARYLHRKFLRPVRWGYWMVSAYGGWEGVQQEVAIETCERLDELKAAGVTALSIMAYLDHPGATGALGKAEGALGIKTHDNQPKPAFHVWRECLANGASWLESGQPPPGGTPKPPPSGDADSSGCDCRLASGRSRGETGFLLSLLLTGIALGRRRRSG